MLFLTDIVLNHISFDSPILKEYPDITYNNTNTTQLLPAIELELVLHQVSDSLEKDSFSITTENDVDHVIHLIEDHLQAIRFSEYWMVGLDVILHSLSSFFTIQSQTPITPISDDVFFDSFCYCLMEGHQGHRFPITIDGSNQII